MRTKLTMATARYIPAIIGDRGKTVTRAVAIAMKTKNRLMRLYEMFRIVSLPAKPK
jgi:DNA-binding protein